MFPNQITVSHKDRFAPANFLQCTIIPIQNDTQAIPTTMPIAYSQGERANSPALNIIACVFAAIENMATRIPTYLV